MSSQNFHKHILILVALPLIIIEVSLRIIGIQSSNQFAQLYEPIFRTKHNSNLLIIGSSRAATAIVPDLLESETKRYGMISGNVYNLGMGYTKIAQHALAIKKLANENPIALHNSIILIETIGGIAEHSSWDEAWFHPAFPHFILPFLDKESLTRLLKSRGIAFESKLFLVPAFYMTLPAQILLSRGIIFEHGALFSEKIAVLLESKYEKPDIARAGGIRFDIKIPPSLKGEKINEPCDLSLYTKLAKTPDYWDKSIVREINDIVKNNGGKLVFFNVPITPKIHECMQNDTAQVSLMAFLKKIQDWGALSIILTKNYSYEDFADAIHLKLSRSAEYSTQLIEALKLKLDTKTR